MAFQLLATALLAAHLTLAAPGSVCSKLPYKAFLPLSKNAFVESVCSSKFPVAPVTVTSSTTYTTSTATASTTTTISETTTPIVVVYSTETDVFTSTLSSTDVQTEISTTTISTTSTSTSTVGTSTTTIVTNANGATFKRAIEAQITPAAAIGGRAAAAPAAGVHGFNNNARAKSASSACASFTKGVNAVRSIFSTACSCIETPITYQSHDNDIYRDYFHNDLDNNYVLIHNDFDLYNHHNNIRRRNIKRRSYTLRSSRVVNSFYQCLTASDADLASTSFTYQFSTGTCNLYANGGDSAQFTANADFVYGYYYP
ncbi:hypothetical protein KC318_g7343 [Hortaea werneckii]|nr:hypothetical protein KC334_g6077 [Hortaea werneckii]KAI7013438.1 hypothetical protein KC355_g5029 [Hortaea werneckii]KAI7180657.1 hypothetical protein KC324_g9072 [Hortaea werneckii]KAI7580152.1 hypothetical protein KC316_g9109 [Hortaea werneckii]KAI7665060.1 hypothetical protein KC318_g7343 [Hortaea werneckii]